MIVQPRMGARDLAGLVAELPAALRPRRLLALSSEAPSGGGRVVSPRAASESIACILYTSGTTGTPKGVMLSHRAILATVAPTAERGGLAAGDVMLSTLPLFWVAGLVIRALPTLASGAALLTLETFSADAMLAALRAEQPTALHLRPPQVGQLLAHADFDPALLAPVRRGGGRVDWFAPHLDAERVRFVTGYGMTETAGYVTALDWRDPVDVRATRIGTPLPGVELRIVDGEVRVRGPGLFSGYHHQPPGTGLDADGFFRTGDLGRVDTDGTFHFAGRSKDLLRVKGINVSPVEVETVLAAHPAVDSVYVVGLPPDGLEQEIVALIVARGGAPLPEAALRAHAAAALSHYKRPTHYVCIGRDEVPLGGTAKPQRAALAALAADRLRTF
jgi:fatty-acyl-CoA synthase